MSKDEDKGEVENLRNFALEEKYNATLIEKESRREYSKDYDKRNKEILKKMFIHSGAKQKTRSFKEKFIPKRILKKSN